MLCQGPAGGGGSRGEFEPTGGIGPKGRGSNLEGGRSGSEVEKSPPQQRH